MPLDHSPKFASAQAITRTLRQHGHAAYFAGGCVRDLLLGVEPKDFDVATSARPEEVAGLFPRTLAVGAHFGVMLVLPGAANDDESPIEVATFRHDGVYTDGRRPDAVRFSTDPGEDVARRDFTINGMLLDPEQLTGSETPNAAVRSVTVGSSAILNSAVFDRVGGRADLAAGIVRTIGPALERFTEDKLRMLRGIRFAARLQFAIAPETMAAMRVLAPAIEQVSYERVRDELTRMLTEGHPRLAFELLHDSGLLAAVLPEVARMQGVEQPPQYHPEGDVWVHTLMLLDHLPAGVSPTLAWGMLLHDVGKPATFQPPNPDKAGDRIRFNGHAEVGVRIAEVILERLRFSNDDKAQILELVRHHMRFGDVLAMKASTRARFLRMPRFEEHLALHRADCLSSHGMLHLYDFARRHFEETPVEVMRPRLLVTGKDLIAAGYKPGPSFKRMLEAAEDAQLEGRVQTPAEGLALIGQAFGAANGKL